MLRPAPVLTLAALSFVSLLAGCAKEAPPPPPPQAAYVPPPLVVPPAAPWCARPAEVTAFSVAALKSNLMVTYISCRQEEKYNAFVARFRPALLVLERVVETYFSRSDKRHWQQTRDDYITQLANAQSQRAMVLGSQFCERTLSEFDELNALTKPEEVAAFASTKTQSIPQAFQFSECTADATPTPKQAPKQTAKK